MSKCVTMSLLLMVKIKCNILIQVLAEPLPFYASFIFIGF